ncbi:heparan-alpha-glucosaminide N-acetyltransferase domain-containing protein [Desulfobacter curvatus]|uniref:heparan-alpha-glucosaminide N-acetyltransferase domain-containing protein n=1 Tax=Desulfobacter curvatus TaxID=2290 RepID=UPI00035F2C25|nr:heparan-alpha-glucosaminide N-acetyltransferase domain-containing protein [Desulfobacter curvatus]
MNNISGHGSKRIQGYDLARGVAIFAMVIIDFKAFFCIDETFPEWLYAIIEYMDRRAAAALVIIAGAGMTLMSGKAYTEKIRDTLFKRAVFLILCGILIARIWPADILHFYGFFILTGLVMVQLSSPGLLVAAGVFWLGSFIGLFDHVGVYLENLAAGSLPEQLADLFFTGYYPVFPWAALYLFGMWLGRQDLKNRNNAITLLGSGLLAAVLSECAGYFIPGMAVKTILAHGASDETAAYIFILLSKLTVIDLTLPSPVSIISGAGTGLCVIILSFLCTAGLKQGPPQSFMIVGKNTLSLYVLHILFIKGIENLPGIEEDYPVLWCTAGAILFVAAYTLLIRLWLKKFAMGPLESAMRYFPFVKAQRIVKEHPGASAG